MENSTNESFGILAKKYVAAVIETTGDDPEKDGVVMLSAVRVVNGRVVGKFKSLSDPELPVGEEVKKRIGLSDAMLVAAPKTESMLASFLCFVGGDMIVGKDIEKKLGFLNAASKRLGGWELKNSAIDIMTLNRSLFPEEEDQSFAALAAAMLGGKKSDYKLADTIPETLAKCYEALKSYCEDNGILLEKSADMPAKNGAAELVRSIRTAEREQVKTDTISQSGNPDADAASVNINAPQAAEPQMAAGTSKKGFLLDLLPMLAGGIIMFVILLLIKNRVVGLAVSLAVIVVGALIIGKYIKKAE